ncbi:hypothetical protein CALVIDRAFT_34103 [Calocera viscosa TUFC12733]|uniref:Uncharacterized protein n=1 Tax=Calocera viscosa (strain TUFC12733) TaxID=1330018 RepID=A0A167FPJ6_CALVF|nr:hypothetical protein CALVIDRAFT_34103 [Calocera viscosa TUFC12733]
MTTARSNSQDTHNVYVCYLTRDVFTLEGAGISTSLRIPTKQKLRISINTGQLRRPPPIEGGTVSRHISLPEKAGPPRVFGSFVLQHGMPMRWTTAAGVAASLSWVARSNEASVRILRPLVVLEIGTVIMLDGRIRIFVVATRSSYWKERAYSRRDVAFIIAGILLAFWSSLSWMGRRAQEQP